MVFACLLFWVSYVKIARELVNTNINKGSWKWLYIKVNAQYVYRLSILKYMQHLKDCYIIPCQPDWCPCRLTVISGKPMWMIGVYSSS